MVGKMLGEHNESNGHVCNRYSSYVSPYSYIGGKLAFENFHERKIGIPFHIFESRKIYKFYGVYISRMPYSRKNCGKRIAR